MDKKENKLLKKLIYIDELDLKRKKINLQKKNRSKNIKIQLIKKFFQESNNVDNFLEENYNLEPSFIDKLYYSCCYYDKNA